MSEYERVETIMSQNLVTIQEDDPISRIRQLFLEHKVHHLPVVKGEKLIGMVSWTDLMRVSFGEAFGQSDESVDVTLDHTFTIGDVMQDHVRSIYSDESILEAAKILAAANFHCLPVVSRNQDLVGIVTVHDLMNFLLSLCQDLPD